LHSLELILAEGGGEQFFRSIAARKSAKTARNVRSLG
jgi:hypothetical protein